MIRVANAPCSWGVLEFDGMSTSAPYGRVLDEMQETGYAGTELGDWGFMPTDPDTLRVELDSRSLTLLAAFVPVALAHREKHKPGIDDALRVARLLAALNPDALIVLADDNGSVPTRTARAGRVRPDEALDDDDARTFARGAEEVARAVLEEAGLRTVFHHHGAGWIETPAEVARLLDATPPELLGLCLDTGHCVFGGGDPLDTLARFGDRVWHVHFKDCREVGEFDYFANVKAGVFCELGRGRVDFGGVTDALRARDYDGWVVVEQDVLPGLGTPRQSAARNRAFLKKLGL